MEVIFETSSGSEFTLEIGFFASVMDIKEAIQKYQGIPVSSQVLIFNNKILVDEGDTIFYNTPQDSRMQLKIVDAVVPKTEPNQWLPEVKVEGVGITDAVVPKTEPNQWLPEVKVEGVGMIDAVVPKTEPNQWLPEVKVEEGFGETRGIEGQNGLQSNSVISTMAPKVKEEMP